MGFREGFPREEIPVRLSARPQLQSQVLTDAGGRKGYNSPMPGEYKRPKTLRSATPSGAQRTLVGIRAGRGRTGCTGNAAVGSRARDALRNASQRTVSAAVGATRASGGRRGSRVRGRSGGPGAQVCGCASRSISAIVSLGRRESVHESGFAGSGNGLRRGQAQRTAT